MISAPTGLMKYGVATFTARIAIVTGGTRGVKQKMSHFNLKH